MSYRIVAFYANPRQRNADGAGFAGPTDASMLRLIELLHASAERHDRDVRMTVLSDTLTDLTGLADDIPVVRYDLAGADLMMARTRAQSRFVGEFDFAEPLAFLDIDILVNRPLAWLFERPFDIAVTVRRKDEMPINGGVILAGNRRPEAVRSFFSRFVALFEERYAEQGAWWGDQRALNAVAALPQLDHGQPQMFSRDGVNYLTLPASAFNHSPHALWFTLPMPRRKQYLLHFKSDARKKYIRSFYLLHMQDGRQSLPSRLVSAYRSIG